MSSLSGKIKMRYDVGICNVCPFNHYENNFIFGAEREVCLHPKNRGRDIESVDRDQRVPKWCPLHIEVTILVLKEGP